MIQLKSSNSLNFNCDCASGTSFIQFQEIYYISTRLLLHIVRFEQSLLKYSFVKRKVYLITNTEFHASVYNQSNHQPYLFPFVQIKSTEMYHDSPPTEGSNRPKKQCSIKLKISLALQLYKQSVRPLFINNVASKENRFCPKHFVERKCVFPMIYIPNRGVRWPAHMKPAARWR